MKALVNGEYMRFRKIAGSSAVRAKVHPEIANRCKLTDEAMVPRRTSMRHALEGFMLIPLSGTVSCKGGAR